MMVNEKHLSCVFYSIGIRGVHSVIGLILGHVFRVGSKSGLESTLVFT